MAFISLYFGVSVFIFLTFVIFYPKSEIFAKAKNRMTEKGFSEFKQYITRTWIYFLAALLLALIPELIVIGIYLIIYGFIHLFI